MVNLFTNAARAMESGGTLTVTTDVTQGGGLPGPVILIIVEDTGIGIAATDLPRIFDPFYTTHSRAGGTGLGLAISRGIVEEHRGKITVESEVGKGTRFRIYLPAGSAEGAS
jgi:signal transduction histidine kinase